MTIRDIALGLAQRGFHIFRVKFKDKTPLGKWKDIATKDTAIIEDWAAKGYNLGVACGPRSGVWVLDVDDEETNIAIHQKVTLPATYTIKTAKGYHYYFQWVDELSITNAHRCKIGKLDVRGDGGYVVGEGSTHETGHVYGCIDASPVAVAPSELIQLLWPPQVVAPAPSAPVRLNAVSKRKNDYSNYVTETFNKIIDELRLTTTGRNNALNKAAHALGTLVASEWAQLDQHTAEQALYQTARAIGLTDREIPGTIDSGLKKGLAKPRPVPQERTSIGSVNVSAFTTKPKDSIVLADQSQPAEEADIFDDKGVRILPNNDHTEIAIEVLRIIRKHGEHVVSCLGELWQYRADEGVWACITEADLNGYISMMRGRMALAPKVTAKGERSLTFIRLNAGDYSGIRDVIMGRPEICNTDFFDDAPKGFAFANGFLRRDGETVVLEEHGPQHRQRFLAGFDYDPNAECPLFEQYLNTVLPGKDDDDRLQTQDQLLQFLGAAIMGDAITYHKAMLLYGEGANGKSTLLEIVGAIVGPKRVSYLTPQDIAEESGYRLVMMKNALINMPSELPLRELIDSDKIKSAICGEPVVARSPREKPFSYRPKAAHIFAGNELPRTADQSYAFYRRFLTIPFTVTIPEEKRDKYLAKKIIASELSGVVAAMIAVYKELIKEGNYRASKSEEVLAHEWKNLADPLYVWTETIHEGQDNDIKPDRWYTSMFVYRAYEAWAKSCNFKPFNLINFGRQIQRRGWQQKRTKSGSMLLLPPKADQVVADDPLGGRSKTASATPSATLNSLKDDSFSDW